jgi:hypothetical protein
MIASKRNSRRIFLTRVFPLPTLITSPFAEGGPYTFLVRNGVGKSRDVFAVSSWNTRRSCRSATPMICRESSGIVFRVGLFYL